MKKILILTAILMINGFSLLAQAPPPPPTNAGNGGGPVGGGAPIASGVALLLTLGIGYGTKKVLYIRKTG